MLRSKVYKKWEILKNISIHSLLEKFDQHFLIQKWNTWTQFNAIKFIIKKSHSVYSEKETPPKIPFDSNWAFNNINKFKAMCNAIISWRGLSFCKYRLSKEIPENIKFKITIKNSHSISKPNVRITYFLNL